ncbi:hypothetical protein ACEE18_09585 [Corynebacterium freneyi]
MERARKVVDVAVGGRPRTLVLAECWSRAAIDAPALCNKAGQPVARAVKCLIDPLIIRPRLRPHLAAPLLDDAAAADLTALLADNRVRLSDASAWFLELRRARRRRGITEGNAQELYFPRAHELAVMRGAPGDLDAGEVAAECDAVLSEIHSAEVTAADIAAHLAAPGVADAIAGQLADEWTTGGGQPGGGETGADGAGKGECPDDPDFAVLADETWMLLDEAESAAPSWDALVESGACAEAGLALRSRGGVVADFLAAFESPESDVALSVSDPSAPPPLVGDGGRVLDRSVDSRCRSALRRIREHGDVGDIGGWGCDDGGDGVADFVADEVARVLAPFGLSGEGAHITFLTGIAVAAGLQPLNRGLPEGPRLIRELQARLRKEAYIMHVRRLLVQGGTVDARQERVVAQLAEFHEPYLNRLWPRLHGLDVLGREPVDADEARELLSGVTRSVVYDHRQLVRTALEAAA